MRYQNIIGIPSALREWYLERRASAASRPPAAPAAPPAKPLAPPTVALPVPRVQPAPAPAPFSDGKLAASAADVLRVSAEVGFAFADPRLTASLIGRPVEDVERRLSSAKFAKALCDKFRVPSLASVLIDAGVGPDHSKRIVAIATALRDNVEIDGTLLPDGASPRGGKQDLNPAKVYEQRNAVGSK